MSESKELNLVDYFRIIAKRKWLVVAGTLAFLLVGIIVTQNITPVYEATAKLTVFQKPVAIVNESFGESYQAMLINERLARTFSEMLKGRVAAEQAIANLNLQDVDASDLQNNIDAQPVKDTQLIQLKVRDTSPTRARLIANALGTEFAKSVEQTSTAGSSLTQVSVVEPALDPADPISPKPMMNGLIAVLLGLVASISVAMLLERMDVSVRDLDEVEALTGLVAIGKIPRSSSKSILVNDTRSPVAEAYRTLRTNIQYLNFDNNIKKIVVTSSVMREGKTTLSANLGIVLAEAGNKVLVIDCDLRKPRLHQVYSIVNETGLSEILAGQTDIGYAMKIGSTNGLSVLTSGAVPPNPADLLGSKRMDCLLKSAEEKFDYVILDCPPVLAVTDAAILAAKADGVILAAFYGQTNKNAMFEARAALDRINAHVFGFVVNGVEFDKTYGGYSGYGGYGNYRQAA